MKSFHSCLYNYIPNPSALNRSRGHDVALDVVRVHVGGVHGVGRDAMVLLGDGRLYFVQVGKVLKMTGSKQV